jgi:alkylation response protein AidB-like acyl-CoA dehydrogenase
MGALDIASATETSLWLEKVDGLAPIIAQYRDESEDQRYLAKPVYEAMRELGLFKLWLPKVLGGDEIDLHTALEITERLAKFDGSTAWNFMIGLQGSVLLGYIPEYRAREMMEGTPDATLGGSGQPGGVAVPVEGGYRITGRWSFASGSHHTRWLCGNCQIHDDGVARVGEDGNPEMRMFWFNSDEYQLIDTWFTTGLRASGSGDCEVNDVFVPEDRYVQGMLTKSPYQTGTIFQTRVALLLGPPFSAVAIGVAREALAAFIELATKKKPSRSNKILSEYDSVANLIGRAEAKINAAHAYLHNTMCERLWPAMLEGNGDSEEIAVDVFYASAFAAQNAAEAVDILVEAAGGTGIYETSPLERCFRDVHMVSKHAGSQAAINYTRGGNFRLGFGFSMRRS